MAAPWTDRLGLVALVIDLWRIGGAAALALIVWRFEETVPHKNPRALEPGTLLPHLHNTCPARVRVDQAFFRADEWLGDSPLLQQTEPVRLALGVLYQSLIAAPDMLL